MSGRKPSHRREVRNLEVALSVLSAYEDELAREGPGVPLGYMERIRNALRKSIERRRPR